MIEPKDLPKLESMLEIDEGSSLQWYKDTEGFWTNGIGHLATKDDNITEMWTFEQQREVFYKDLAIAMKLLEKKCPWVLDLDSVRHCALVNMCFNLNSKLFKFKKMLQAIQDKNWQLAHDEALNSNWAGQVKDRSKRIAHMFKTGSWSR